MPSTQRIPGERSMLAAMTVNAVGSGMYLPFTLIFFHHVTGLSFAAVGAVLTAAGLIGLTTLPLAGTAVDRFGARRVQLVLFGVRGLGFALYPFAQSVPAFAVVALVTIIGDGAFPAVQQSFLGEIARGADRDRLQAASRALSNGGMGAGALLASLVVGFGGDAGFTAAAWLNAASFILSALLMWRVRPVLVVRDAAAVARQKAGYRLVLRDRPFLGLTAANFLIALGYTALPVLYPLYISTWLHGPESLTGAAFTVNTVLCAAGGVLVASFVRRRGARRNRSAALGAVLFAVAFAGQIVLGTVRPQAGWAIGAGLAVIITVHTIGEMVHNPSAGALAIAAAPDAVRGRYMAAYQFSWQLVRAIAPSLFTGLMAVDGRLPWLLLIGTTLGAALLLVRLEPHLASDAVHPAAPRPVAASPKPDLVPAA
ncbi:MULTISPECIES: MFS transporter [unclassified Streptomyces]|uniref:MFS transporter n=1 Tax=unclassified Streptomyces TaxID=2593676 RepID=UPI002033D245|nr:MULTISPECIES: MFS transporter [unclassified Streptomyces]MCM2419422.1 MFS transporter [Streptomyces sp. RKAG293]MCM2428379.1 MFS transporter [Streptomyces sp. RKAG337]